MDSWDSHFQPLLASHDPGEAPLKGGLLLAHYGKGIYIYNAYSFFRELPTGVPGAIRLYVNLLSAGHEKQVSQFQGFGSYRVCVHKSCNPRSLVNEVDLSGVILSGL